ncbi:hypothetical protein Tco_0859535 [Tanacetum coccineum]|uniref:Uncharacterized protein n=1 Tax=Tanacetum coccineum TaxID=301880 RepID=A0ABQ5BF98_9ASTR
MLLVVILMLLTIMLRRKDNPHRSDYGLVCGLENLVCLSDPGMLYGHQERAIREIDCRPGSSVSMPELLGVCALHLCTYQHPKPTITSEDDPIQITPIQPINPTPATPSDNQAPPVLSSLSTTPTEESTPPTKEKTTLVQKEGIGGRPSKSSARKALFRKDDKTESTKKMKHDD